METDAPINPGSIEDYVKERIAKGYIGNGLQPLKCEHCGSTKPWKYGQCYRDDFESGRVEFAAVCQDCGEEMGYWAYGYWQI